MVRMLCSLYYAEHSATMSLSFPRKKYYSKCQRPRDSQDDGVQTRTEMWWTWPCCWHVVSCLLRGGGRVFLCAVHPLTRLTSERLPLQRQDIAWLSISAAGVWELRTQKYRKLSVPFPQRSKAALSCGLLSFRACAASWRELYFPFISVMELEAFMAGVPSVQLWASNSLVSLWALCLSFTRQARIGNQGTSLGKMGGAPQLHTS